jgi:hypothetical protein
LVPVLVLIGVVLLAWGAVTLLRRRRRRAVRSS